MKHSFPLVFDIARGSLVDGPGIRTVVFFKGCPLNCGWCQNPESQNLHYELMLYPEYCIKCGNCQTGCDAQARRIVGRYYTPSELAAILMRDEIFFETSGGGVTFSGGEPLLFIDYLEEVSQILKQKKIHITLETCGYFNYPSFIAKLLSLIDLIYYDIKIMDAAQHEKHTGKPNELIINNLLQLLLLNEGPMVVTRTPVIPGITDTGANLARLTLFLEEHNIKNHVFLPYNPAGEEKRSRLKPLDI